MINQKHLSGAFSGDDEIFKDLQNYFIKIPIPDSIRFLVDNQAHQNSINYRLEEDLLNKDYNNDSNPYELEYDLKNLVRSALGARAQSDSVIFYQYMQVASKMASFLSGRLSNRYWEEWLNKIISFNPVQAQAWLKAEVAHDLCRKYHDKLSFGPIAEEYGAYAFQCLRIAPDKRLELDIKQRLQVFLFYYYSYHRLSVIWADINYRQAKEIGYHLRANGFYYHKAEALHYIGENDLAIQTFIHVIDSARLYGNVPYMSWFDLNGHVYLASCYIENDQLGDALNVCMALENYNLQNMQKTQLHILYGLIYRITGQYEKAEMHYNLAQKIIELENDYYNQIVVYNNLGFLYFQLTEYHKSLYFLDKGMYLIDKYQTHNKESKSRILLTQAGVHTALGNRDSAEVKLSQTNQAIISLGFLPVLQSELLIRSGEIYMELDNFPRALQMFEKADSLCQAFGLIKYHLDMMTLKIPTLIKLEKYDTALEESERLLENAQITHNKEKMIEAYASLAEIAYAQKNIVSAVNISEKMLIEIEQLCAEYNQMMRLTSFRQKIYDFLKRSVFYEIENKRISEAFIKLGYAKARPLQISAGREAFNIADRDNFLNPGKVELLKKKMKPKSLLLDYFLNDDTLFVFAIDERGLQLFRKAISAEKLESDIMNYINTIQKVISIYDSYDSEKIESLYENTIIQGHQLFEVLLGFEAIKSILKNIDHIYLVKDEFLYQLPFSTLVWNQAAEGAFLIEQTSITNIPSNEFLYSIKPDHNILKKKEQGILLSADLEFPGVDKLVTRILAKYPVYTLMGNAENIDKMHILSQLQGTYDKFIFIGHGISNPDFPELSELIFKPVNNLTKSPQIAITLGDLFGIGRLNINLGILLGCETGKGKLYRGSGMMGFQHGHLIPGDEKCHWNLLEH